MRPISTRLFACLIALLVVTSGSIALAGTAVADPTSTGDLATDGTDTITDYNASADRNHTVTYDTDLSADTKDDFDELSLEIRNDGHTYASYSSADAEVVSGSSDGTTTLEVQFTVNHADLEKLPGDANQVTNTTYNFTERETGVDEGNGTSYDTTVGYEFADDHAVRTIHSDDSSLVDDLEVADSSDDDGWFGGFSVSSLNPFSSSAASSATIEDDVGINGSQTDVHVYSESDNVTSAFDDQLEDADDSERVGMLMTSNVDDGIVYVFANEPGEKIGGENVSDSDSYIVANEGGEYMVNMGDDYEGQDTASLELVAGQDVSADALQSDLGYGMLQAYGLDFGSLSSSLGDLIPLSLGGGAAGASLAGVAFVASRKQFGA
ncbi:hypothetical protein A6E15_19045 [Natrinema saccharevitans]|uniref:Uncharacterized protein n=1 Tax=Natrinema saccharevitans TaxID=301967 RepID=A0A1S8AQD0_9EURY|nr:hypothetical protein [Natrinema saccharevitans]OLZ39063.1 hypothetical protein A6E15_19045 [Natrinema saccharevitans]